MSEHVDITPTTTRRSRWLAATRRSLTTFEGLRHLTPVVLLVLTVVIGTVILMLTVPQFVGHTYHSLWIDKYCDHYSMSYLYESPGFLHDSCSLAYNLPAADELSNFTFYTILLAGVALFMWCVVFIDMRYLPWKTRLPGDLVVIIASVLSCFGFFGCLLVAVALYDVSTAALL